MTLSFWFLLILGIITYVMVQRSVARITRTPVWLLWLVLMAPTIILSGWMMVNGTKQPPPRSLMIWSLILCPLLYWVLFQWGRRSPKETPSEVSVQQNPPLAIHPISEPAPVRPIEPTEETQLRSCFPWSVYYIQNIEYRPQAIICRGQLRTKANDAYHRIKANIEAEFGDRFLVIFQEGLNGKPFFVLVPNTQTVRDGRQEEKLTRPVLALLMLFITLITTTWVGTQIVGVAPREIISSPNLLLRGLPYSLGLLTVLGFHEMGHYLTARYYKIRATLPYFIPMPLFLGTFGAFIQMRSPVPNRKALFDVSIAGPLAGFIVTLPLLIWGLTQSEVVSLDDKTGIFNHNALNPRYSILLSIVSKLALGSQFVAGKAIDLHPLAVAGFLGVIVTGLNLMPVGQLDGGHIIHSMLGQKTAIVIGQIARLCLLLLSLVQSEFLLWAIILLFLPLIDEPALNDVTELDNGRDILGILTMALLIVIVLPLPQFAQVWLQI
ncbi:MAG: site-2 protease family protein [Scytonematopsis contorta HA4267-MV1]|jgi:membrane-associated protease RseP (regulator of RpoE activity)|nr:site-2 protease family protein [Scytonematopsis contorta HA4267-MV1]